MYFQTSHEIYAHDKTSDHIIVISHDTIIYIIMTYSLIAFATK